MSNELRSSLGPLCLAASFAALQANATAQQIEWSADRPLVWSDFVAPVARETDPANVAVTASSLGWDYEYEFEHSADACTYRITAINGVAAFHPGSSWVKPGHRTAHVLAHEQGHFDLTQIHKLAFDESTRGFVGAVRACKGNNRRRISKSIETEITRLMGPLYEQLWQNHTRLQDAYDRETGHGTLDAEQQTWLERISSGLRGRGWRELGFADQKELE